MTTQTKDQKPSIEKSCATKSCSPCENGTTAFLFGGALGAYGTTTYITSGFICPSCVIGVPLLLAWGFMSKKRAKKMKERIAAEGEKSA